MISAVMGALKEAVGSMTSGVMRVVFNPTQIKRLTTESMFQITGAQKGPHPTGQLSQACPSHMGGLELREGK